MEPVVACQSGKVQGGVQGGVASFLGLPYARAPFGEHRFKAPIAVDAWEGIRPAFDFGPTAPQPYRRFTIIPEPVIEGEDCLNLNVFTPDPAAAGLPVLVWIHGGGFTAGCNNSPWYRGEAFARDGVVLVSVNYRLGAEGFLVIDGAPSNRAVLDWLAALRWVQDNIAAFGGDPSRVTIAGQSAGGVACATLLASPAAAGLFHSAVCMSGAALPNRDVADGRELTAILAQQLGIEPTLPAFASVAPQALADAQDAAAAELGRRQPSLRLAWGPLIDGEVVSGMGGLKPGAGVDRLMAGATAEEFNALVGREGLAVDEERMRRRMGRMGLGPDAIDAYRATMPDAAPAWVLGQASTDSWFRAPTLGLVDTWAERGGRAWLYSFEWVSRSSLALGSVHCLDVPFFFDNLASPGVEEVAGPTPQPLADVMHRAVVDFVKGADPGWPHWEPGREPAVVYDDPPRVVEHPWPLVRSSWFAGSASAAN